MLYPEVKPMPETLDRTLLARADMLTGLAQCSRTRGKSVQVAAVTMVTREVCKRQRCAATMFSAREDEAWQTMTEASRK